jgi:hypothetical protein
MSRNISTLALVTLIALACTTLPATDAEHALTRETGTPSGPPPETLDEPPAAYRARDNRAARSPGMRTVTGSYTSVQVNVDEFGQNIVGDAANEPSIAVNPTNPDNLVIAWRQFDSITSNFRQGGWAFTTNRGATWTFPGVLEQGVFRSDPVLATTADGKFFYQSLMQTFELDVFKSLDGGATWPTKSFSFGGDKNWMAIDTTTGPGRGNIYGIWQRFAGCCGFDVLTRSSDEGDSFETPVAVDRSPTFGTLAVGPDGELYAAGIEGTNGQDFSTFVVSVSTDAELSGSTPTFHGKVVDLGGSMRFSSGPNPAGLLGQATIAVSHSQGPSRGNAYLVASVNPPGDDPLDVHIARSTNGGVSWNSPVKVNDDASTQNWQWFGAVSVGPRGRIDVAWYDTRNSGQDNISELFYSYSMDQGLTWSPNVAVSPPFNSLLGFPQQNKMGDYLGIESDWTGADVAYAATFNGEQDVYYTRLYPDCNQNAVSDVTDVQTGDSRDCNFNRIPDECEIAPQCAGSGGVPDGRFVGGTPLTLTLLPNEDVTFSWGPSCVQIDNDYEVYEGNLGDFTSHTPRLCSTDGETSKTFTPSLADTYYLVVPTNLSQEGSYGLDSEGSERPISVTPCRPQQILGCLDFGF